MGGRGSHLKRCSRVSVLRGNMPLTRFEAKGNIYSFPTSPGEQTYRDNFAQLRERDAVVAGADGAFDEDGSDRPPSKKGQVQVSTYLAVEDEEDMQALRDALKKMQTLGRGRLFFQPKDTTMVERWCWAKAVQIDMPEERKSGHAEFHQPVSITFKVNDPFWYTATGLTLWGAAEWGTDVWGGGTPISAGGLLTSTSVVNGGNVYTQPQIALCPDPGDSCSEPIIRRVVAGEVLDEIHYYGALAEGDLLMINCRKHKVTLNGAAIYSDVFKTKQPAWMRLEPGTNSLEILLAGSGDAVGVNIQFYERFV
jgi:Siphovirus-type tail component, C-terminal domain